MIVTHKHMWMNQSFAELLTDKKISNAFSFSNLKYILSLRIKRNNLTISIMQPFFCKLESEISIDL